jgi:protein-tyrosine phosphatase
MGHFVDLHCHYLPALDDGSADMDTSLRMIRALVALGFTHLFATPHQRAGMFMPARTAIDAAFSDVTKAAADIAGDGDGDVRFGLAAENFWDDVFHARLRQGLHPSYDGGPAFLFEVNPQLMPPRIDEELFQMRVRGMLPVMAHPERYVAIQGDLALAEKVGRSAALLIDLAALDGAHGRAEMKTARRLIQDGLVHAAASDAHSAEDQGAVASGIAWIRKHRGDRFLNQLLDENPRRIITGDLPEFASA